MGAAGEDSDDIGAGCIEARLASLHVVVADDIGVGCIEARLASLHEMIVGCDSDQSMIWDREPEVASQFLRGLDEVRQIVDALGEGQEELRCFAHDILQTGMSRLEEELVHVLVQNQQPVVPDHVSFRSTEDDSVVEDFSSSSFDEESIQGKAIQSESSRGSEEYVIDVVHPDAIPDLRSITRMMFLCSYDKECRQAYVSVRKDVLDECLSALRVERLSIEEVVQMDRSVLNSMIKRWNRALKVFVRVYLASERRLCDLIFGEGTTGDYCFHESSKSSVLQLLTFGEAIAIGPRRPELLFRMLDMYEGLSDLIVDLNSLFPEDSGSFVVAECHEVLFRLGECVRATFDEFKNAIRNNTSSTPFSGGGVHPLAKYVMNYIRTLADYGETLDLLLKGKDEDDRPLARQLQSVASILEENLEARSTLYSNSAIQSLFKMNNVCYMVQKVRDSDLRGVLGDDWVRAYSRKFRLYAMSYERASWTSVLAFLKDEGVCSHGSSSPSRTVLKERFKSFNLAFEELYRTQTGWIIPNLELREDLKISISLRVIQAYRTFVWRYAGHLDGVRHRDSYIKYCPEDLEACLLDLFEGLPKVMHPHRR
ncbi:exocyst complex component EXO70B1-like [Iris pallida]|uniref:Exocyst subunit Exo70 family protein n=1 Tax=Iris pallida TaxID=29817 RepID=A0AAX6F2S9_IRIPA|nr:exocyst complex component EXO70B1-like [Iris pallida]